MNSEISFQISSSRSNTQGILLVYTMQGALMDHLFQKFIQGLSVPPLYWRAQQCKAQWSSQHQLVVEGWKHIERHSPRLIHLPHQIDAPHEQQLRRHRPFRRATWYGEHWAVLQFQARRQEFTPPIHSRIARDHRGQHRRHVAFRFPFLFSVVWIFFFHQ